jgi:cyanophycinase-like exopeptidase
MGSGFLDGFPLHQTVVESHFVERDRMGRIVSFLARAMTDHKTKAYAIACDQSTAVLVSPDGTGKIVILVSSYFYLS